MRTALPIQGESGGEGHINFDIESGRGGHEDKGSACTTTTEELKFARPVSIKKSWSRVIRRSTLYGITLVTQIVILNVAAALAIDFGIAESTLIVVTNIAATLTVHFRRATSPKVVVVDVTAALAIDFGIAVSTLIVVTNVAATLTIGCGLAIRALIAVADVAATGMSVGTQHK